MKTAISINDTTYEVAERTAHQLGVSRSKLYSMAVQEFVQNHGPEAVTEQLNQVYGTENPKLDEDIAQTNYDLLSRDEW